MSKFSKTRTRFSTLSLSASLWWAGLTPAQREVYTTIGFAVALVVLAGAFFLFLG